MASERAFCATGFVVSGARHGLTVTGSHGITELKLCALFDGLLASLPSQRLWLLSHWPTASEQGMVHVPTLQRTLCVVLPSWTVSHSLDQ